MATKNGVRGRAGRARRKAQESVFPSVKETRDGFVLSSGLTKKEHIALEVLKVVLAQGDALHERSRLDMLLERAVDVADAFITVLEEDV